MQAEDEAGLYLTEQTSVREIGHYACIGIGEALAHQVLGASFRDGLTERDALSLASLTVATVKDHVPGCGGSTQFVVFRKDGKLIKYDSRVNDGVSVLNSVEWVERYQAGYSQLCRRLFLTMADPDTSDVDFENKLEEFAKKLREIRNASPGSNVRGFFDVVTGRESSSVLTRED
jgi:hypothetical protein